MKNTNLEIHTLNKSIPWIISILLLLIGSAFAFFIYTNWAYITNPSLIPNYHEGNAFFAYGNDALATYRNWGFYYPMAVIPYILFVQTILLLRLIVKKHRNLSLNQWALVFLAITIAILIPSSQTITRLFLWLILLLVLFAGIAPIVLLFISHYRKHWRFYGQTIFTSLLYIVFVNAYFVLFFD